MNGAIESRPKGRGVLKAKLQSPLMELGTGTPEETLARLDCGRLGLTERQVEERRARYGANEISHDKPPAWYAQLFHSFLTPFKALSCSA